MDEKQDDEQIIWWLLYATAKASARQKCEAIVEVINGTN
jgi:hypothetical protein